MIFPNEQQIKIIFKELGDAILLLEDDYLKSIMDKFGIIDHDDFIKELKVYNIESGYTSDEEAQKEEDNAKKKKLIKVGPNFYTEVFYLKSLEKIDKERPNSDRGYLYGIKINEDISNSVPFANKIIYFRSEEERNQEWNKLENKLEYFDTVLK